MPIKVRLATSEEAADWNGFVETQTGSSHFQRFEWGEIFQETFAVSTYPLLAEEGGRIRGILPLFHVSNYLVVGGYLSSFPGGICAPDEEVASSLLTRAEELRKATRSKHVVLRDSRREWRDSRLQTRAESTYVIDDIEPDVDAFWDQRARKFRRQVRKAEDNFEISWERNKLHDFYRVFCCNMRDLGTPAFSEKFFQLAAAAFPETFHLLSIRQDDRVVGGMVLLAHGTELHNPYVSSLREAFPLRPNDLLYWEAIRFACRGKYPRLDLGRSEKNSGHAHFKEKFSARPEPLYYQYLLSGTRQMPSARGGKIYPLFRQLWQRCPTPVTLRLGPWLRCAIPLG